MPAKETVRLRPPQAKDKFQDPVGPVPAWVSKRAVVVPRESQDYQQRGPIIIHGFLVKLPPGTVVTDNYEIEVRGQIHQIDGAVADFGRKGKVLYTMRAN